MKRRSILLGLGLLPLARPAMAAGTAPYRVSLVQGPPLADGFEAGVKIELEPGWKTYWRMPGEAGIAPQFDWSGSTGISSVEVLHPLPVRIVDAAGETIGYENEVVFPLRVTTSQPEASLALKLFFAVCKEICIPAKADVRLEPSTAGDADLGSWLSRVPQQASVVSKASVTKENGKGQLVLMLAKPVDDIFVEGPPEAYFSKPQFSSDGLTATLDIAGLEDPATLTGKDLVITLAAGKTGLEQRLRVD